MLCVTIELRLENTNRKFLTEWLAKTNRKEENMKHPVKKIISHLLMFALVLCVAIAPSLAESKRGKRHDVQQSVRCDSV